MTKLSQLEVDQISGGIIPFVLIFLMLVLLLG